MGVIGRGIVFVAGTVANAILFLFHSRVLLEVLAIADQIAGTGPATGALNTLPLAMQLAMGIFEIGLILYLVGGLGEERTATRRPL